MDQSNLPRPSPLFGIVTDQPEIFESEPALSDDTGVNDLDLANDSPDDAIALIEVPIKQAFSYFAERENDIAKFYVQRHGEYKIAGEKQDDETDIEKYHRLVSEVNQLLNKFQTNRATLEDRRELSLNNAALTSNLEILSKQLKALEFAAEDGTLDLKQSGFLNIKTKLEKLHEKMLSDNLAETEPSNQATSSGTTDDSITKSIRMSALERRLNTLETLLGGNDDKLHSLFTATKCDNLTDAAETLSSWSSLFKTDSLQRLSRELDHITQRMEKMKEQAASNDGDKQFDASNKAKLDQLYDLVTSTDKYRGMVPSIIHRLNAMEELQQLAAQVATTVNRLDQMQSNICESLGSNKGELKSLTEMFGKNMELMNEVSNDIDNRIRAAREL